MKKNNKIIIIVLSIIVLIIGIVFFLLFGVKWLFSEQYNENGISHFLVITIDENQSRKYLGLLDNHKIYIERLDLDETNFRNVNAKNVSIKDAIDKKLVSIDEWRKYANKIKIDGNVEIFKFDNYEIACSPIKCIIRPLSKWFK